MPSPRNESQNKLLDTDECNKLIESTYKAMLQQKPRGIPLDKTTISKALKDTLSPQTIKTLGLTLNNKNHIKALELVPIIALIKKNNPKFELTLRDFFFLFDNKEKDPNKLRDNLKNLIKMLGDKNAQKLLDLLKNPKFIERLIKERESKDFDPEKAPLHKLLIDSLKKILIPQAQKALEKDLNLPGKNALKVTQSLSNPGELIATDSFSQTVIANLPGKEILAIGLSAAPNSQELAQETIQPRNTEINNFVKNVLPNIVSTAVSELNPSTASEKLSTAPKLSPPTSADRK